MGSIEDAMKEETGRIQAGLDTSIREFVKMVGHKGWKRDIKKAGLGQLPIGIYFALDDIGRYVDTIGDLKKLAESADGFSRLKQGVYYNDGRCLPSLTMSRFGRSKLEILNKVLAGYGIEPIPWLTRKYAPWERRKEKGEFWDENLNI